MRARVCECVWLAYSGIHYDVLAEVTLALNDTSICPELLCRV